MQIQQKHRKPYRLQVMFKGNFIGKPQWKETFNFDKAISCDGNSHGYGIDKDL